MRVLMRITSASFTFSDFFFLTLLTGDVDFFEESNERLRDDETAALPEVGVKG